MFNETEKEYYFKRFTHYLTELSGGKKINKSYVAKLLKIDRRTLARYLQNPEECSFVKALDVVHDHSQAGSMDLPDFINYVDQKPHENNNLCPWQKRLVKSCNNLPKDTRNLLINLIDQYPEKLTSILDIISF